MKLEHGKRYVMRNGEITPPVCDLRNHGCPTDDPYCFGVQVSDRSMRYWTNDGRWQVGDADHKWDIVAEYVEPQPPKWVPFTGNDWAEMIGRTIRRKRLSNRNGVMIICASESYVGFSEWGAFTQEDYASLLKDFTFPDGTPCGKLVQP